MITVRKDPKQRFVASVKVTEEGHWLWQLALDEHGYGSFWLNGETMTAHRAGYILFRGHVPDRVHVHHLAECGVKSCVCPWHMKPLTAKEHLAEHGPLQGFKVNREKTHCPRGHEYTPENTYVGKSGSRFCRACRNAAVAAAYRKKKEASPGPGSGSQWAGKTHCPAGHEYSAENTYINPKGSRVCLTCKRLRGRERERQQRAKRQKE